LRRDATGDQHGGNGSLRAYVEQFTTVEPFGSVRGMNDWYQAECILPGCEGRAQSLYIFPDGNQELFECHECERSGGLEEFAALMSSNAFGQVIHIPDRRAADVTTRPVEWYWAGRIPKGKLTMCDGDPDLGKSVVTMDIAARGSTGRDFPDGAPCEAGNVLIVNVEDGVEDTIVPRLKAHGADLNRVFILSSIPDSNGGTRLLDLPRDLPLLENKVLQRRAKLLIIDPVLTMLGGDANKDQDARKALTPIADMAERTGTAVVGVRHLNKSIGLKAIQRGGGNMGLIGVARAGLFFAEHPDDDRLRVMAAHKTNLAEKPPSLSYRIVTSTVHNTARVEWMGATEHDANSLAAGSVSPHEKSELEAAKEFLREELKDGPVWAKRVYTDARDAGISERTLRRAKDALRVKSEKVGTEGWAWSLPSEDDHGGKVGHVGHVGHVQNAGTENSLYISEGVQDGQGVQGGQDGHVGHEGGHLSATPVTCIHEVEGGCWLCQKEHPEGRGA
jgi:putative DNA primase/helicase